LFAQAAEYFVTHGERFWGMCANHLEISALALAIAVIIGVPAGILSVRCRTRWIVPAFNMLRVVPSLAVLLLLLPILGTVLSRRRWRWCCLEFRRLSSTRRRVLKLCRPTRWRRRKASA